MGHGFSNVQFSNKAILLFTFIYIQTNLESNKLLFFVFVFLVSDCVCWEAEVQCKLSTCLSANQGIDIPNFRLNSCHFDCTSSYDVAGHCGVHSCLHAHRLGNAAGKCCCVYLL